MVVSIEKSKLILTNKNSDVDMWFNGKWHLGISVVLAWSLGEILKQLEEDRLVCRCPECWGAVNVKSESESVVFPYHAEHWLKQQPYCCSRAKLHHRPYVKHPMALNWTTEAERTERMAFLEANKPELLALLQEQKAAYYKAKKAG